MNYIVNLKCFKFNRSQIHHLRQNSQKDWCEREVTFFGGHLTLLIQPFIEKIDDSEIEILQKWKKNILKNKIIEIFFS